MEDSRELETLLVDEWLLTNGLGGYSSGTVCGVRTRRYHGLLIASLRAPWGRMVMLNDLIEHVTFPDGDSIFLSTEYKAGQPLHFHGAGFTLRFTLQDGLPVWHYTKGDYVLEKRLVLPYLQNSVHIIYRLLSGPGVVHIDLRPAVNFRPHESSVDTLLQTKYAMTIMDDRYELSAAPGNPLLRFRLYGEETSFTFSSETIQDIVFWMEERRGFSAKGTLWSPGEFHLIVRQGHLASLVASTHSWETLGAVTPEESLELEMTRRSNLVKIAHPKAREGEGKDLVLAADQFLISPIGRPQDTARARAAGFEVHTVIAGYHWFTDWGRDTMISLEGLTLVTGRFIEAGSILRTFGHYIRNGLIPNLFPEGENQGLYHTTDATLWFFHAIDRYLQYTSDYQTLAYLLPRLRGIIDYHLRGTDFGIKVDPKDGLLSQGQQGYQLTWMDAKVDDWVVTPRRGKAVEVNALWYNALRLMAEWSAREEDKAGAAFYNEQADKTCESFNTKFWYAEGNYLYDVIDGEHGHDPACRPNQVFSISLPHPVLEKSQWEPVLHVVTEQLLTPMGLRSLSPSHPQYKPRYYGDLRSRDAAYHQGTVWAWLIGPYIDVWLKVYPHRRSEVKNLLAGLMGEMHRAGIGSVSEIFDAEPPFAANGCIAQAWSVAELLRAWVLSQAE
jgi:predicted glycogen debranching enzyme